MLNVRAYHAFRSARTFRPHEEDSVREDLEELLLSDLEGRDEMVDLGWDAESMREEFGGQTRDEEGTT